MIGSNARQKIVSNTSLPESWVLKPIGQVCNFEKGKKPKNTGHRSNTRMVPYINIKSFETGIPEEYAESGNYPTCSKHDVLIVWDGARSGLVGSGVSGYIGSTLSKVWSNETDNKYLFYFLKSQYDYINTNTKGVGIPHVDPGILNAIKIPIAPLDQQKLIVAEIEKQFSRLDEAVAALKRIQANLKRYKASVLKAAVEGKLTAEWRKQHSDVEPADKLLKRILAERKKKWEEKNPGKKYKEPAPPNTSNLPDLPKGWVWASLDQISDHSRAITYGVIKLGDYIENGIPTLRSSNVRHLYLEMEGVKRISPVLSNAYSRTILQGSEVLVTVRGTLGGVINVPETCAGYNISREVAMIAPLSSISSKCLAILIGSKQIQNWLIKNTKGIAYTGINIETLKVTPVPLMGLNEQHEITQIVEQRLSVIDEVELNLEMNLKRAERLRQSILKRAFSGKLIKQDELSYKNGIQR